MIQSPQYPEQIQRAHFLAFRDGISYNSGMSGKGHSIGHPRRDAQAPRVCLFNLGCYKNLVDAEVMLGRVASSGASVCEDPREADVLIVNTCCFIRPATRESSNAIKAALQLKRAGRLKKVIVAGCMAQKHGIGLLSRFPGVDAVVPLAHRDDIAAVCAAGSPSRLATAAAVTVGPPDDSGRLRLTCAHVAYLRISEGCDNRCSYCVVPSIRGPHRSRPANAVLREARELVHDGARELILIAQDTAAYGMDTGGASQTHRLLESMAGLGRLRWIRLLYAHPAHISAELISAIADTAKVVRYLDMPVQHASDRVLRLMRRRTTARDLKNMVDRLRDRIPGIALRTSVIVGFPGETAKDFDELLAFIERARFERLGAFEYSREVGTAAARMPGRISARETRHRLDLVMALQRENSFDYHQRLVGSDVQAIVDSVKRSGPSGAGRPSIGDRSAPTPVSCSGRRRPGKAPRAPDGRNDTDWFVGRTQADAPEVDGTITIEGRNLAPGDVVRVRVTAATEYDLHGVAMKT
ncbi:MAG: 30S ribosomal protein S12 methylthiotransferase RimO [Planctomycetota bacterium]|nr:30S ribosomal protein S12 methylthiotransferase RimO [Planctomycetota bacterium]